MRVRHLVGTSVVALLATSCNLGEPEDAGSLNLFIETDKIMLAIGETMTITVLAKNVGSDPLTLTGPSDCLLYVQVLNVQGLVVWQSNGTCAGSPVTRDLASGEELSTSVTWSGQDLAGARLPAGYYVVRPVARLSTAPYIGLAISVALE